VDIGGVRSTLLFGRRWSHRDSGHGRVCTRLMGICFFRGRLRIHRRLLVRCAGWDGAIRAPSKDEHAVAEDLHALLHAAGVPSPYVLVGSSFSGFNVRCLCRQYPSEVAGAVLVDSAPKTNTIRRVLLSALQPASKPIRESVLRLRANGARVGLVRLLLKNFRLPRNTPEGFTDRASSHLEGSNVNRNPL